MMPGAADSKPLGAPKASRQQINEWSDLVRPMP